MAWSSDPSSSDPALSPSPAPDISGALRALGEGLGQGLSTSGKPSKKRRRRDSSPERPIWLWSLVPIIFACLRLIVVSRGDPETLRALVQNLNITALVLATVLPLGATLASWMLFLAALGSVSNGEQKKGWRALFWLLLLPTLILVWFAMPLNHIVANTVVFATIVVILICWAISQHMKAKVAVTVFTAGAALWVVVVLIAPFILLLARSEMWLPKEQITVGSEVRSPVYVLSTDDRWTRYMDGDHEVHIVSTPAIADRQTVGTSDSIWHKTLAELFS